jgi:hypothetical protein
MGRNPSGDMDQRFRLGGAQAYSTSIDPGALEEFGSAGKFDDPNPSK